MPFKDFAAGELLTSSDVDTYLMSQVIIRCTSSTRPSSPAQGWHIYETDTSQFMVYNGSSWVRESLNPSGATVATSQSTSNTSYTDLTTTGPSVTVTTRSSAIIVVSARVSTSASGSGCSMGHAVSGASSLAASETKALLIRPTSGGIDEASSYVCFRSDLTPGSNIFTAKYRATSADATFMDRNILVIPV